MRISGICECIRIGTTLLDHWNNANRVLHLRILGPDPGQPQPTGPHSLHVAIPRSVLKPSGRVPAAMVSLMQNQASRAPDPYDVGQELVVFLQGSRIVNDDPGLMIGEGSP